jgi:hypothetical protein
VGVVELRPPGAPVSDPADAEISPETGRIGDRRSIFVGGASSFARGAATASRFFVGFVELRPPKVVGRRSEVELRPGPFAVGWASRPYQCEPVRAGASRTCGLWWGERTREPLCLC